MKKYYVNSNAQPSRDHEAHVLSCDYFQQRRTMYFLESFLIAMLRSPRQNSTTHKVTVATGVAESAIPVRLKQSCKRIPK
jgi:hypothetical protein